MHPYETAITDETRARIAAHLASLSPYTPPPPLQPGQIQLDANPDNAPGCIRIEAHDGRDLLVQTDWDWPSIASAFGWSTAHPVAGADGADPCPGHSGTDGTVPCPHCKLAAGWFISAAREWIDSHDGATAADPGYF